MDHDDPALTAYCDFFSAVVDARWDKESLEEFEATFSAASEVLTGQALGMMIWTITTLMRRRIPTPEELEELGFDPATFLALLDVIIRSTTAADPGEFIH
ncbi:hypothetical protein ENSA5_31860 [Enhygromyxa salina]|uniref:Uncharacterized protein n=1 Tax=Enhygromyxa salina TaxID=215803 RepID=A0A2S9XXT4_9BACT|nr:hypothetical protein [Enhygromyxa salina]PRP97679.1 hypothetical protein ENSA5_31860 [Enhygromyxa salina]